MIYTKEIQDELYEACKLSSQFVNAVLEQGLANNVSIYILKGTLDAVLEKTNPGNLVTRRKRNENIHQDTQNFKLRRMSTGR